MPPNKSTQYDEPRRFAADRQTSSASSIRVVSDVTGLPMDTLRAWERRYGFPKPERREGSNRRLYSAEDVERLGWIARALERGYRPADVIEKPAAEISALLGEQPSDHARDPEFTSRAPKRGALVDVAALMDLLSSDDVSGLEAELRLAAAALGPRRFVTDAAHPLAIAVGEAWAAGRLAVRQEHLMTECLTTQLRQLLGAQQDVSGGPVVVLATLPGEQHTLGLQMAAVYLAVSGIKPRLLGPDAPPGEILSAVNALDARAVGLTVTPAADVAKTRRALRGLAPELPRRVPIWIGGGAASRFASVSSAVRVLESWAAIDVAIAELQAQGGVISQRAAAQGAR